MQSTIYQDRRGSENWYQGHAIVRRDGLRIADWNSGRQLRQQSSTPETQEDDLELSFDSSNDYDIMTPRPSIVNSSTYILLFLALRILQCLMQTGYPIATGNHL